MPALVISEEDSVSGNSQSFTTPVAVGNRAIVDKFGAALPGTAGAVDLHWGDDVGGWELIRAIAGGGTYEFSRIFEDYIGDGVKMFRVTRTKTGGGGPMAIRVWFKAIER